MYLSPSFKLCCVACLVSASMISACSSKKAVNSTAALTPATAPTTSETESSTATTQALEAAERLKQSRIDAQGKRIDATGTYYLDEQGNLLGKVPSLTDILLAKRMVWFDYDASTVRSQDNALLEAHAQYIKQNPNSRIRLQGHTDERGTREYNMALGERRAKAVQAFMIFAGVGQNQLDIVSFGEEKPLNEADTEAAWQENRRVEIEYLSNAPQPK